jgi:glutamate-1-semialdehyde 2,1-aminomutase
MTNRPTFAKSQEFTRRLERVVPGGAHTYSKGRDQFPQEAPSGIVRGEGSRIWDIDGNRLLDWGMSLASVSIGHGHPEVVGAVCRAIQSGVNFSRPAALEAEAAERFVRFSGDDMVKFARHGSCVNSAAVKIARAFTGRSKVAVAAEHPFFSFDDWFIASTATDFGIPEELKKFTLKFHYNDIESLRRLFEADGDDIACVMLEPVKFDPPGEGFLQSVREICTERGAVLVFDEMQSGLKFPLPGAGRYLGVKADLSTWGKGIGNGFSVSALSGSREIMQLGGIDNEGQRKLFLISTTHGAELVGLSALIATLDYYERTDVVGANWATGRRLRERLTSVFGRHGLSDHLSVIGYDGHLCLTILGPGKTPDDSFRTLLMQELIANGVLFQGTFVVTPSHGPAEIEETANAFDEACAVYARALGAGTVEGLLTGPAIKPVFRRYV